MADQNITTSRNLLKRLEDQMDCMVSLMKQLSSLSSQVLFVSSGIRGTWAAISAVEKSWKEDTKEDLED